MVVTVAGLIIVSGSSSGNDKISTSTGLLSIGEEELVNPLDELSSADIAVNIARVAQLEESTSVTNKADTANASLAAASAEETVVSKPQVVAGGLKSKKDIVHYKSVKGDTIQEIAKKYGITSDTIRLSNNLSGDTIPEGTDLIISPINGVVYTVKEGDTPESIANRFRADPEQVIVFNDAELTRKFKPREKIIVPDGLAPARNPVPYNYTSPNGFAYGTSPRYDSGGNGYDYGWCTWHVAERRKEVGKPIPSNLGNAISWLGLARSMGMSTGAKPRQYAVVYQLNIGGLGHVAFVERMNPDGSALVSDMNYPIWGTATTRTIKPSEFSNYRFIY